MFPISVGHVHVPYFSFLMFMFLIWFSCVPIFMPIFRVPNIIWGMFHVPELSLREPYVYYCIHPVRGVGDERLWYTQELDPHETFAEKLRFMTSVSWCMGGVYGGTIHSWGL